MAKAKVVAAKKESGKEKMPPWMKGKMEEKEPMKPMPKKKGK